MEIKWLITIGIICILIGIIFHDKMSYKKTYYRNKAESKHAKLIRNVDDAEEKFWRMPSTENYYDLKLTKDILNDFEREDNI